MTSTSGTKLPSKAPLLDPQLTNRLLWPVAGRPKNLNPAHQLARPVPAPADGFAPDGSCHATGYVAASSSCFSTLRFSATAFFTRDVAIPPMSLSGPLIRSSTVFVTTVPPSEDPNS